MSDCRNILYVCPDLSDLVLMVLCGLRPITMTLIEVSKHYAEIDKVLSHTGKYTFTTRRPQKDYSMWQSRARVLVLRNLLFRIKIRITTLVLTKPNGLQNQRITHKIDMSYCVS